MFQKNWYFGIFNELEAKVNEVFITLPPNLIEYPD